ncbi:MAG: hypothetical protein ACYC6M_15330, partial [Terriglobales bacterium]
MKLTRIEGHGIKGQDFTEALDSPVVLFTGHNGVGKSARLLAAELALAGPGRGDLRWGPSVKATCSVRVDGVPADVSPTGRLEVLRALAPKHSVTLQPAIASGKDVQARIAKLLGIPLTTWRVEGFWEQSADKQSAALLALAVPVPASEYQDACPEVPAIAGEAASAWVTRALAAMRDERLAM